jgi:3-dehydroquinate dehydratase-2
MPTALVLNGPNLNLLGAREPEVYGTQTLADVERICQAAAAELGLELDFRQSNHEGQLIDWIHEAGEDVAAGRTIGVVFNPGAYTHTSLALHDAIKGAQVPVIEVHISNVHRREAARHHSFISAAAVGIVAGFGVSGYPMAIRGLYEMTRS